MLEIRRDKLRCCRRPEVSPVQRFSGCDLSCARRHQGQSLVLPRPAPFRPMRGSGQNAHGAGGMVRSNDAEGAFAQPDSSKGGGRIQACPNLGSWHICPRDSLQLLRPFGMHLITRLGPLQLGDKKVIHGRDGNRQFSVDLARGTRLPVGRHLT